MKADFGRFLEEYIEVTSGCSAILVSRLMSLEKPCS